MTDKEIIAVVQHHEDGGEVEVRSKEGSAWVLAHMPIWDFCDCDYRAKPEQKKKVWFWSLLGINGRWFMSTTMFTEEGVREYHKSSKEFEKIEALGYRYED